MISGFKLNTVFSTRDLFLYLPFFLFLGILCGAFSFKPNLQYVVIIASLYIPIVIFTIAIKRSFYLLYFTFAVIAGYSIWTLNEKFVFAKNSVIEYQDSLNITAEIADVVEKAKHTSVTVNILKIAENIGYLPQKIVFSYYEHKTNPLSIGDKITFTGSIFPRPQKLYFSAYEYERQLFYQGIDGFGKIIGNPITIEHKNLNIFDKTINIPNDFRHFLSRGISMALIGKSLGNEESIMKALLIGERAVISKDVNTMISRSGLTHILSISGLHIGIACWGFYWLVKFILIRITTISLAFDIKKISACFGMFGMLFYLAIAGFPMPGMRSFIMIAIILLAQIFDRDAFNPRSLAIAAMIIMLRFPSEVFFASFQLTFLSVASLVFVFRGIIYDENKILTQDKTKMKHLGEYFGGLVLTSVIAFIGTFFCSMYHFGTSSLSGVVSNMIVVPLITFIIMPLGMLYILLSWSWFGEYIAQLTAYFTKGILLTAELASNSSNFYISLAGPSKIVFATVVLSFLLVLVSKKYLKLYFLGIFILGGIYYICFEAVKRPLIVANQDYIVYRGSGGKYYSVGHIYDEFLKNVWIQELGVKDIAEESYYYKEHPYNRLKNAVIIGKYDNIACKHNLLCINLSKSESDENEYDDDIENQKNTCNNSKRFTQNDFYRNGVHAFFVNSNINFVVKKVYDTCQ